MIAGVRFMSNLIDAKWNSFALILMLVEKMID